MELGDEGPMEGFNPLFPPKETVFWSRSFRFLRPHLCTRLLVSPPGFIAAADGPVVPPSRLTKGLAEFKLKELLPDDLQ